MRLDDLPESSNVSDQRGMRTAGGIAAGGGGLLLLILGLIFGVDMNRFTGGGDGGPPPNDQYGQFAAKVVGSLEAVWKGEFAKPQNGYGGAEFEPAQMILFSAAVNTGCGRAPSSVGPFYCPRDQKIYLDPTFFAELEGQLGGSKAQFSQAYVMAHEYGHHVQNLLGFSERVRPGDNRASVHLELQADYLAGVWAHHADKQYHILEGGDLESAIKSANAIGDDKLQRRSGGFVHPEKYTHGTARQRTLAFQSGFRTGDATKGKLDRIFTARMGANGELDDSVFR
jgi:predicted metalloprotease